jgi:hypothetical protein
MACGQQRIIKINKTYQEKGQLDTSKEDGLEVNGEKKKYILMSHHHKMQDNMIKY